MLVHLQQRHEAVDRDCLLHRVVHAAHACSRGDTVADARVIEAVSDGIGTRDCNAWGNAGKLTDKQGEFWKMPGRRVM